MIILRQAITNDADFVFDVKKSGHSQDGSLWSWEDGIQRDLFRLAFLPEAFTVIQMDSHNVGVLTIEETPTELWLHEIYLLPNYRNQGIGTAVIQEMCARADRKNIPLKLQVLKTNPAQHLYERLGFKVVDETDPYFHMIRSREPVSPTTISESN